MPITQEKDAKPAVDDILRKLRSHLPELQRKYAIRSLGLFGSYVRGRTTRRSDLDILVEFDSAPTFFEFIEIEDYLSEITGVKVDLVMKKALKPGIGKRILDEMVVV